MRDYGEVQREHVAAMQAGDVLNVVTLTEEPRQHRYDRLAPSGYCHLVYSEDPRHFVGAVGAGLRVGTLFDFNPWDDPIEQAGKFAQLTGGTHLLPTVQIEAMADNWGELIAPPEPAVFVDALTAFLTALPFKPAIKVAADFWDRYVASTAFGGYPLWVVDYATYWNGHAATPTLPAGWSRWLLWEYTDAGFIAAAYRHIEDFSLLRAADAAAVLQGGA